MCAPHPQNMMKMTTVTRFILSKGHSSFPGASCKANTTFIFERSNWKLVQAYLSFLKTLKELFCMFESSLYLMTVGGALQESQAAHCVLRPRIPWDWLHFVETKDIQGREDEGQVGKKQEDWKSDSARNVVHFYSGVSLIFGNKTNWSKELFVSQALMGNGGKLFGSERLDGWNKIFGTIWRNLDQVKKSVHENWSTICSNLKKKW